MILTHNLIGKIFYEAGEILLGDTRPVASLLFKCEVSSRRIYLAESRFRVRMKKGQVFEGVIESVEFPNKGQVYLAEEGKKVVVKNGVPGQKVRFSVNKIRKGKAEGRLLEVLERSPIEVESKCPHFGVCGGCTYQNLTYEEQLGMKEVQVRQLLKEFVADDKFEGIKRSPNQYGYRNKMEFSFGDEYKDGPLALGMHKRGSFYDIANVSQCQIVNEDYHKILTATLTYFTEIGASFYHRIRHEGYLRHLLVRRGEKTGEILIDLVTTGNGAMDEAEWVKRLLGLELDGKIVGILHTYNDGVADVVKDEGTDVLYGRDYFYEELLGMKFKISPFSFFQTNSSGAEVLYQTVQDYIGETKDKVIFDLYSGTGTIAQIVAPVAEKVVGVEIVEAAVQAARVNARLNVLDNCVFWAGDVLKVVDELGEKPDLIVLDPPRDGIHAKALGKIIGFGVDKMVYVSCKPTSLARDLEILRDGGYEVERACCVDLFPGTVHVETCVLLSRASTNCIKIKMEVKSEDLVNTKPTYKRIQEYILEKNGLKVHTANIAEVKRMYGLSTRKAFNLKEDNVKKLLCSQEKIAAIEGAFRHFGMIDEKI